MKFKLSKITVPILLAVALTAGCSDNTGSQSGNKDLVKEQIEQVASKFRDGVHYEKLPIAIPRSENTLTEVFSFTCPHCYKVENELMKEWKESAKNIDFEIIHSANWAEHAKVYYTLLAMDEKQAIQPYFKAVQNKEIKDKESFDKFLLANGVNIKPFELLVDSNLVKSKIEQAENFEIDANIKGVPTFIVAGKYKIIGGSSYDEIKQIAEFLIKEKP